MRRAAARKAAQDPVSVILPPELRSRVASEAKRRGLGISPTIRVLLSERVRELDEREELDRALEWQRAQAWATWELIQSGDDGDVGFDAIEAEFERALAPRPRRR